MAGHRTPGPQGHAVGGSHSAERGRLRSCSRLITNGQRFVKQNTSWSMGAAQTPQHRSTVAKIYFPTDSSKLDDRDRGWLRILSKAVKNHQEKTGYSAALLVVGGADHRGEARYNLRLAAKRAIAVKAYILSQAPKINVWARTVGEAYARQPDLCEKISQRQLAEDRRTDVIFARYKIIMGDPIRVVVPSISEVVEDAITIVAKHRKTHTNQVRRLLCYLNKLKGGRTARNDSYWTYGDWQSCQHFAYSGGRFNEEGLRHAGRELQKRSRSARWFLRGNVATTEQEEEKFRQLLKLDRDIFGSWQDVADFLAGGGSEKFWPYWVSIKNTIIDMQKDPETLYSCLDPTRRSVWEYVPV